MLRPFYLDTAIWLDFFENRNEPGLPKGEWANKLLIKIIKNNELIIISDLTLAELTAVGYPQWELKKLFRPLKSLLLYVESTKKEIGKAKDLSKKRRVPKGDALHALIARDHKATLVTLDKHFHSLKDIIEPKRPQDLL